MVKVLKVKSLENLNLFLIDVRMHCDATLKKEITKISYLVLTMNL